MRSSRMVVEGIVLLVLVGCGTKPAVVPESASKTEGAPTAAPETVAKIPSTVALPAEPAQVEPKVEPAKPNDTQSPEAKPSSKRPLEIDAQRGVTVRDDRYVAISEAYSFDLASLHANRIKIADREERPGITSVMTAECDNGLNVAVVATRIRADYPKDDSLLTRQKPRIESGAGIFGDDYEWSDREEDGRRLLERTLLHESYDPAIFPLGVGQKKNEPGKETIGVHRVLVRSGYFYEVAIIVANDGAAIEELKKNAKSVMKRIVAGIRFPDSKAE